MRRAPGFSVSPNYVLQDVSLSEGARLLYAILLGLKPVENTPTRMVLATHGQLASYTGTSVSTVQRRVVELAEASRLVWVRGGYGRPNRYELLDVVPRDRPAGAAGVETRPGGREEVAAEPDAEPVEVVAELVGPLEEAGEPHQLEAVADAPAAIEAGVGTVGAPESSTGARAGHVGIFPPTAAQAAQEAP